MPKAITIVLERGTKEFVEIENDNGFSIKIGKHEIRGDYHYIRITSEDIENIKEGAQ